MIKDIFEPQGLTEKKLFDFFVGFDDNFPLFQTPIKQGDYVYATDRHILIKVDVCELADQYKEVNNPRLEACFHKRNCNKKIAVITLEEAIKRRPEVEEIRVCDDCEGSGEVEWTYEGWHDVYTETHRCPVCGGKGDFGKTGRMVPDPKATIGICQSHYSAEYLNKVVAVAKRFGIDELTIICEDDGQIQFAITPTITILLAGCMSDPYEVLKV